MQNSLKIVGVIFLAIIGLGIIGNAVNDETGDQEKTSTITTQETTSTRAEVRYTFTTGQINDLKERCNENSVFDSDGPDWEVALDSAECRLMVEAATGVYGERKCSYSDVKEWIELERYKRTFWLFIEENCGPISSSLRR